MYPPVMIDDLFVLSLAFLLFLNSPRASARSDAKCCVLQIFGRVSEPAKVFSICCISHFTFSLTLLTGVTEQSTEQRIKLTFVLYFNNCDRAGYKSRLTRPNITFIFTRMYVLKKKKGLLLCKCTGRVCGEVQTLTAHPVWDSLSCVFCPKTLEHTHAETHPADMWTPVNHAICATLRRSASRARREDPNRCTLVSSSCKHPRRLSN